MPITVQTRNDGMEVTVTVSNGGGGPLAADVSISWSPSELSLKVVKQPPADFSGPGLVRWNASQVPSSGKDFVVELQCKASGTPYVLGSALDVASGASSSQAVALGCG